MLEAAGVPVEAMKPNVDEDALKDGLMADGVTARNLADALAEAKAVRLSGRLGSPMVLGADQVLALEDGTMLDKPRDADQAKEHLRLMSGRKHKLFSAAAIAEQGSVVWRHVDIATLAVRQLSDDFIDAYVDSEWGRIKHCVGCYEIEGRGVQLFSAIQGSQFTIMGLPLLHLLDYLRVRGVCASMSDDTPYAEVIGDPIAQSKSPAIHKFWLEKLGIAGDYRARHVQPDQLASYVADRKSDPNWRGCNVTIPHKMAITELVDDPGKCDRNHWRNEHCGMG